MKYNTSRFSIIFGSNHILDCSGVIEIAGVKKADQIFRVREAENGRVFCDCKVKNADGDTIVKVANGAFQYLAPGYVKFEAEDRLVIKDQVTQEIVFEYREVSPREWVVNGIFRYPGLEIRATDKELVIIRNGMPGPVSRGFIITGSGRGILIGPKGIGFGSA